MRTENEIKDKIKDNNERIIELAKLPGYENASMWRVRNQVKEMRLENIILEWVLNK